VGLLTFYLDSDWDGSTPGQFYLTSDDASGAALAVGAGVAVNATPPAGQAVGYTVVTFVDPIDTGYGSIAWASGGICTPVADATMRYPTAQITVYANGDVDFPVNPASVVCYYDDGSGEIAVTLTLDPIIYAVGAGVTDTVSGPAGSAGIAANATGAGVTDTASAPSGSGTGDAQATGAGVTDTATTAAGTAGGAGAATGAGITDTTSAPSGSATGGTAGAATGAGVTVSSNPATAFAAGSAQAAGGGITDNASAPAGGAGGAGAATGAGVTDTVVAAQGFASAPGVATGAGVTDTISAPTGTATVAAQAQGPGVTDIVSAPAAAAAGGAAATGAGVTDTTVAPQGTATEVTAGQATGAGVTVEVSPPTGSAEVSRGDFTPFPDFDAELVSFILDPSPSEWQMPDTKLVYLGRDNICTIGFYYDDLPLDLGPCSRAQLNLLGSGLVIDTNNPDQAFLINWKKGDSNMTFKLGLLNIPPGLYTAALAVYDEAHPHGQLLAGPQGPMMRFNFVTENSGMLAIGAGITATPTGPTGTAQSI